MHSRKLRRAFARLRAAPRWGRHEQPQNAVYSAVDDKTPAVWIGRRVAHQVDGDAAEIGRLAEAPYRNPRHHVGDEFVVGHDARRHIALDPAGQYQNAAMP